MSDKFQILKRANVIAVTHVYGTGASQDLVRYLITHETKNVLAISHPLFYDPHLKGSGYEIYRDGKLHFRWTSQNRNLPLFFGFFLQMIKSVVWVMSTKIDWDLYVGSNNLNAFVGLLLKRFGKVKKVVYYVIDFNPYRYKNSMINRLYQWLDQYCVLHADETWNLSPRMKEGRQHYFHFSGGQQIVVPVGIWKESLTSVPVERVQKHTLAFLGHVIRKQGIQYVLDAIPIIIRRLPDFHFLVIGGGEFIDNLNNQAKRLHVEKYITFTGYISDHRKIDVMLGRCAAGVALYDRKDEGKISFTYFTEPTKIKSYLAAGLPIFVSDVPYNAKEIEKEGCGRIISYDPVEIADAVTGVLGNDEKLRLMRSSVRRYRTRFNWEVIFDRNLKRILT